MTATTFHSIHPGTLTVACDVCGAQVASSDRDRTLHADWHEARNQVIELAKSEAVEAARQTVIELRSA